MVNPPLESEPFTPSLPVWCQELSAWLTPEPIPTLPSAEPPAAAAPPAPTLLLAPPECEAHHTCPAPITRGSDVPPENVNRLRVLTAPGEGGGAARRAGTR